MRLFMSALNQCRDPCKSCCIVTRNLALVSCPLLNSGCWEESAQDVVMRAGRGEFDRDWIDKAVEEGAIGAAEATDWSALYYE